MRVPPILQEARCVDTMAETWDILTKLLERTNQDKVNWQTSSDEYEFLAVLGEASVTIRQYDHFGKHAVLRILNEEGREIEELDSQTGEGSEWYEQLRELYSKARRIALGVDSQLDALLKALDTGN